MQKDGKLDLDEPVTKYLPTLKFYNDELTAHVTLRDMMCHRTGLPRHDLSWALNPTTRDSLMLRLPYLEPANPLRKRWEYNNFMFTAQGVVAESLTGKSWDTGVRARILEPLGMSNTVFTSNDMIKNPDAALGYEVKKDSLISKTDYFYPAETRPAGSINSNVLDMVKWVSIWINGGKLGDKEILPTAYVREAMTSQMVVAGGLPTQERPGMHLQNYGFGWMLSSYKGHYRVDHGGNTAGFSASTCFFPADSVGIVVLANQEGSQVPPIVRNILADRMLRLPHYDWNKDLLKTIAKAKAAAKETQKKAADSRKSGTKSAHPLADYAGEYNHPGYGTYAILAKSDSLFLQTKTQRWWLGHYHYETFQAFDTKGGIDTTDTMPFRFQFTTGLMGEVDGLAITGFEPSLPKPLVFSRQKPVEKPVAEMKK